MLGRKVGVLWTGIHQRRKARFATCFPGNVNAFRVSTFFPRSRSVSLLGTSAGWRSNCVSIFITETNLPKAFVEFGREVRRSSFVLVRFGLAPKPDPRTVQV